MFCNTIWIISKNGFELFPYFVSYDAVISLFLRWFILIGYYRGFIIMIKVAFFNINVRHHFILTYI